MRLNTKKKNVIYEKLYFANRRMHNLYFWREKQNCNPTHTNNFHWRENN